jgi:hypothetical protein
MGMDTWYDLQLQELVDLTDRVNGLLEEIEGSSADAVPTPAPGVRELFELTDRVSDLLKDVRRDK